jgi:hypothetical protein
LDLLEVQQSVEEQVKGQGPEQVLELERGLEQGRAEEVELVLPYSNKFRRSQSLRIRRPKTHCNHRPLVT